MTQVGQWFDSVIVDSPPLSPMADSGVWMNLVDGVLLVVRTGRTPKKIVRKAVDLVEKAKLLGIVVNGAAETQQPYYYYYDKQHQKNQKGGCTAGPKQQS